VAAGIDIGAAGYYGYPHHYGDDDYNQCLAWK
jgi:hypothetical protein